LLLKHRPFIRPFQIYDGDRYHKDMGILWASHNQSPFYSVSPNGSQESFASEVEEIYHGTELVLIEDFNSRYKSGKGPVAVVGVHSDGWRFEPHAEFFFWATPRNVLRATVSFFQMLRNKKSVGVCIIKSLLEDRNLFDKCCEYGVIHYVGRIENGDPRGDEYVYSVKGRKKCLKP